MFNSLLNHLSEQAVNYVLAMLVIALPSGITLAIFTSNPWWLLLSAASLIVLFAG